MLSRVWADPSNGNWSVIGSKIIGTGKGIGSYGISYFINELKLLNGQISADLSVYDTHTSAAAGLVCRATSQWAFVASYFFVDSTTNRVILAFGVCDKGTFVPITASDDTLGLDTSYHLSLSFFAGKMTAILEASVGSISLSHFIPQIAFAGHVGVMKLYETQVALSNVRVSVIANPIASNPDQIYQYDVFVSHASADKATIIKLLEEFRRAGIRYWVDHEQIGIGQSISKSIEDGIKSSKHVLVCLSKNLGNSNWCRAEYSAILNRYFTGTTNKRVLPLYFDLMDEDIPNLLYDLRRVNYNNPAEFRELINYVKNS